MNDQNIKKNILITGATSGIGLGLAKKLNEDNFNLFITGRNVEKLNEIEELLKNSNLNFKKAISSDLCKIDNIDNLVKEIDILDGIVLNAGVIDYTPVKLVSEKKILDLFNLNVFSNFFIIQKLLQHKKIRKGASIVFVSSIASKTGVPGTSIYASTKGALNSYAKVLASELSIQKIRVNVISPGIVKTNLISNTNLTSHIQMEILEKKYPFGLGEISDIINLIDFLLSDKSKWITGSNIDIEGGYLLNY